VDDLTEEESAALVDAINAECADDVFLDVGDYGSVIGIGFLKGSTRVGLKIHRKEAAKLHRLLTRELRAPALEDPYGPGTTPPLTKPTP
jgi:uncharacterized protein YuzE